MLVVGVLVVVEVVVMMVAGEGGMVRLFSMIIGF